MEGWGRNGHRMTASQKLSTAQKVALKEPRKSATVLQLHLEWETIEVVVDDRNWTSHTFAFPISRVSSLSFDDHIRPWK
jgi:hypothetical protein